MPAHGLREAQKEVVLHNKMSALAKPVLQKEDGRDLARGPGYDGNMDAWNYGFSPRRRVRTRSVRVVGEGLQYMYIMIGMAPGSMLLNYALIDLSRKREWLPTGSEPCHSWCARSETERSG